MAKPRITKDDVGAWLGLLIICSPTILLFLPDVKPSREEVRPITAYHDCLETRLALNRPTDRDNFEPRTTDPWGQPYRIERANGSVVRVSSSGGDKVFSAGTDEGDDIHSDMLISPEAEFQNSINRKWLFAFGKVGCVWLIVVLIHAIYRKQNPT